MADPNLIGGAEGEGSADGDLSQTKSLGGTLDSVGDANAAVINQQALAIAEVLSVATPMSFERTIMVSMLSTAAASDSFSATRAIGLAVISSASASDSFGFSDLTLGLDIRDLALALTDGMVLDDGDAAVWVLNLRTGAAWRYENYAFSRFLRAGQFSYGVREDGIYLLDGNDDAGDPIRASVDLGSNDFGTSMHKRAHTAYFTLDMSPGGIDSTGGLYLRVTDDSGQSYMYAVKPSERMNTAKVKLGRGLVANFFDLQLFNTDGADFELASGELLFDVLKRRV